jgi:GNAT superfamily N-acetyltransferase
MIRAGTTSWSDTVRQDPFRSILLSTVAVVLVLLTPASDGFPPWLHRDLGLTSVLFAIAFQRVRHAAALEGATVVAWDGLMRTSLRRRLDELLDGPYLLATFLLPLSAVSVVIFLPILLLAESTTFLHQTLLLRVQQRDLDAAAVPRWMLGRSALRRIFIWRRRHVMIRIGLALAAVVRLAVLLADDRMGSIARDPIVVGVVALIAISVFVVDPLRSPLHAAADPPEVRIVEIGPNAGTDGELLRRLDAILEASVDAGGIDSARLVARLADGSGHRMLVASEDGLPLGFVAFQQAVGHAAIWWLCVDPAYRRQGIASALIARTMHLLDDADLVLIESDLSVPEESLRRARVGMLRRFGAITRVAGVRWTSTLARADYDLFAVERFGPVGDERLREALRVAAAFSLGRHPEDLAAALALIERASLRRSPV